MTEGSDVAAHCSYGEDACSVQFAATAGFIRPFSAAMQCRLRETVRG